jgi:hypothetical protein
MLLGINLALLIGPAVPIPAPPPLAEALTSVEVTHNDEGRSGFQLTFQVGRSGPSDLVDYPLLLNPLLRPFNRVILMATFNAIPRVLFDGFITRQQLSPSNEPGASTLTLTGEDVSVMMDMVEKKLPYPAQDESTITRLILLQYMPLLLMPPIVFPPFSLDVPPPTERIPNQSGKTDLGYINELAGRYGYVFYVTPGPLLGQNVAYWGPPLRVGFPQPALSVNMGPGSNVEQISFQYDALAPTIVTDVVQINQNNVNLPLPVIAFASTRLPPLAAMPAPLFNLPNVRISTLGIQDPPEGSSEPSNRAGMSYLQAFALAQSKVNASVDKVVTATGELDAMRYGEILTPRGLVGLRGVGFSYDGMYYVKSVTHSISKGQYKQRFTLTREGLGSITPVVRP